MEIRRSGLLYKVAYGYRKQPCSTNVCRLFWSVLGGMLVWPVLMCMVAILYFVSYFIGFLGGCCPDFGSDTRVWRRYRWLPSIAGFFIRPIYIIVLGILLFGVIAEPEFLYLLGALAGAMFVFMVVLRFCGYASRMFKKNEFLALVREYIRARREKICLTVDVVD